MGMNPIQIAIDKQLSAQDRRGIISPWQLSQTNRGGSISLEYMGDVDPWKAERLIHEAIDAKYYS